MKQLFIILITFLSFNSNGQVIMQNNFPLTISPIIDKTETTNNNIIKTLIAFLTSKNSSLIENENWIQSDFNKYVYPFIDIYNIENSKFGSDFFKPTLMEIIKTENLNQRVVKIAFIGHNKETNENQLNSIYNLLANIEQDDIKFSRYLDYAIKTWQTINAGSLTYKISPNKKPDRTEINKQQQEIVKVCTFFKCTPLPIIYYSGVSPKEIFEIKGFDYHQMMYIDKTGGLADFGNIIFSGNNAEIYTHEIVHVYTNNLFPKVENFFDEGLATFIAGSGKFGYEWHRKKLEKFLSENKNYNFTEHTNPFERLYYENETSIPYLSSALILERVMRIYGKEKLLEIIKTDRDIWTTLKNVGLTKENINIELRNEIKLPLLHRVL